MSIHLLRRPRTSIFEKYYFFNKFWNVSLRKKKLFMFRKTHLAQIIMSSSLMKSLIARITRLEKIIHELTSRTLVEFLLWRNQKLIATTDDAWKPNPYEALLLTLYSPCFVSRDVFIISYPAEKLSEKIIVKLLRWRLKSWFENLLCLLRLHFELDIS